LRVKIVVSDIPDEGMEQEMDLLLSIENDKPTENVHVFLRVNKYGKRVMLNGRAEMSTSLTCSRCLKRFSYPLNVYFQEEYVPQPDVISEEHELTDEEISVNYYMDDEIDVDKLIHDELVVSIPIKPLCSVDCAGICPRCGKDLNKEICQCETEGIDPRLLPLKKIKESLRRDDGKE